ncbi:MAG: tetratricopeptide repeat protein [Ardenticatenaceae bacterium]|nr:tetratricopeptide repeat protein [Ardenticatenaceae bacterium]
MESLELTFFNAFQANIAAKAITNFRSANVQGLLIYLAMQAKRPFPRETLAALFWPDEPEDVARQNLRQSLYQLRKVLGEQAQVPFLLVNRQSVQFNPDSDYRLDVDRFIVAIAAEDWQTAVSIYTGELLPGFTCDSLEFEEWLLHQREQLHRQALDALYRLGEQRLAVQDFAAAQAAARRQLAFEPWREEAHRQLMLALAQNGERSAALAQFDSCRQILAAELGTEPSGETTAVYEKILAGETIAPQPQEPIPTPHNLPAHVTPYFGRETDVALLTERVSGSDHRFITLVGEGGLGKSRLAQEIGWRVKEQFADGVWFVPLAGVASRAEAAGLENDIATAIAAAMGHSLRGQTPPKEQLLALLRDRRALLLLDNFEHLLDGADVVLELLQEAQQLRVICTSREPLGFMAEWVYRLAYLPLPPLPEVVDVELAEAFFSQTAVSPITPPPLADFPSVRLFLDRAERANGRFALTADNQTQVAQLCRLTAGIPLALELAAAGLRQWSLAELIAAMQNALDALATRFRDVPTRHRTVRAVFESSWHLLTAAEQQLFASLSVFRSGFTLAAATAVAGATEALLEGLCGKSLLHLVGERYQLHDLLRQFAAEKLDGAVRSVHFLKMNQSLASKHSSYYLNFVAEQEQPLAGATPQIPARAIAADLDNVRLAWQTAVGESAAERLLACANGLADFYQIRGLYQEAEEMLETAVSALQPLPPSDSKTLTLATLMTHQAGMRVRLSQYDAAIALIQETLGLVAGENDTLLQWAKGKIFTHYGEALWRQGELARAEVALKEAYQIAKTIASPLLLGIADFHLGIINDYMDKPERGLEHLERALAVWRNLDNQKQQGFTLVSIGAVSFRLGQLEKARLTLNEALELNQANGDLQGQNIVLNNLSVIATEDGDYQGAKKHLLQALDIANLTRDQYAKALVFVNLGWNAKHQGLASEAKRYWEDALRMRRRIGDKKGEEKVLQYLGDLQEEAKTEIATATISV